MITGREWSELAEPRNFRIWEASKSFHKLTGDDVFP